MGRNKVYRTAILYLLCGFFLFLVFAVLRHYLQPEPHVHNEDHVTICPVKNITGYPCPGCGSVRSIFLLSEGRVTDSVLMNPAGLFFVLVAFIVAVLVVIDLAGKKSYYPAMLAFLNRRQVKMVIIPLFFVLTLLNWYWNIRKGL